MPSSVIRSFAYDPEDRRLRVTFVSGRRYSYHDVPPDVAHDLGSAFFKGTFFNRRIRDRYPCSPETGP